MNLEPKTPTAPPSRTRDLKWGFLRRTVISTVVTSLLVGLFSAVYYDLLWGARYLLFSLWSIIFFSLTGLIFKHLLFQRNSLLGIAFIGMKLGSLGALFAVILIWPFEGPMAKAHVIAMILGITTPFAVLVLRTLGLMMSPQRRDVRVGTKLTGSGGSSPQAKSSGGELKFHP